MRLEIYCFGEFELHLDGKRCSRRHLGSSKVRDLLKVLLTRPDAFFTQDQLIEHLWSDTPKPQNPERALRNYVHQLRKALGLERQKRGFDIVRTGEASSYGFFLTGECWLDTQAFEQHLQWGEAAKADQRWGEAVDHFEQAVALYRGDFLEDKRYQDWAQGRHAELQERFCLALASLAECLAAQGAWAKAAEWCHKAALRAPGHEGVCRQLMRYHCHAGNRDQAIKAFKALESYIKGEIGVEPEAETLALYESVLNGELHSQPPPLPQAAQPSDPPQTSVQNVAPTRARRFRPGRAVAITGIIAVAVVAFGLWRFNTPTPSASVSTTPPIQFFDNDAGGFKVAGGFPPTVVDFDDLPPNTDITGKTFDGIRFEKNGSAGAPLVVVAGEATFTSGGYRCEPLGDRETLKLFPTTGANVLSPGGAELAPGPNAALEDDGLVMVFDPPVGAVGFDVLWQSADGAQRTIMLLNAEGTTLIAQTVRMDLGTAGVAPPGGTAFFGFVSPKNNIARVVVDELDNDNCRQNANGGYDTIRFKRHTAVPALTQRYGFSRQWGHPGANAGEFSEDLGPRGLAVVEENETPTVFVSDYRNNRVQKFDGQGHHLGQVSLPYAVQDMEFDGNGAFYVRAIDHLVKLDTDFNVLWTVLAPAAEWVSYGVCVDSDGNVHVPVTLNTKPTGHKMYKYDPNGNLLQAYGEGLVKGRSNCEASPDGFVYVTDSTETVLRKFSNDGALVDNVRIGNDVSAIAIDKQTGEFYLAVRVGPEEVNLRKYAPDFTPLAQWGELGEGGGMFSWRVRDIELDAQGRVYITDGNNHLIQVFQPQ